MPVQASFGLIIALLVMSAVAAVFIFFLNSQQARGGLSLSNFAVFICDFFYAFLGPSCGTFGISTQIGGPQPAPMQGASTAAIGAPLPPGAWF
jgi:hypothetical protein